jgi:peptidoglycan/xylan/chitin deacetylase (PgdA/CDA1 family)
MRLLKFVRLCLISSSVLMTSASFAKIKLAITVDDLPCYEVQPPHTSCVDGMDKLISVFKKHHVIPFGFVNGKTVVESKDGPEMLKKWLAAGFPLGNHSYSHPNLDEVGAEKFIEDVKKNNEFLATFSHEPFTKIFRYPYLAEGKTPELRAKVKEALHHEGITVAEVTSDFSDWLWTFTEDRCITQHNHAAIKILKKTYLKAAKEELLKSVQMAKDLFNRDINHILLMHDGHFTAEHLDALLTQYEELGVTFITLNEAMTDDIYQHDYNIGVDVNGRTFIDMKLLERGIKGPILDRIYSEQVDHICPEKN